MMPNLIKQIESLLQALCDAQDHVTNSREDNGDDDPNLIKASIKIEKAGRIADEVWNALQT